MTDYLTDNAAGIVVGVRYRPNFSIEDNLGKIIDELLYSEGSFFNQTVFPLVRNEIAKKVLINEATNDKLTIDNSNIILEINFEALGGTFDYSTADTIIEKFKTQILFPIIRKYQLRQINRIGHVNRYVFKESELSNELLSMLSGLTVDGAYDINVRFAKKLTSPKAIAKKEVNDYINAIYNVISKGAEDETFISIDYQKCFHPFVDSVDQLSFDSFIKSSMKYNSNQFSEWLNKFFDKAS